MLAISPEADIIPIFILVFNIFSGMVARDKTITKSPINLIKLNVINFLSSVNLNNLSQNYLGVILFNTIVFNSDSFLKLNRNFII